MKGGSQEEGGVCLCALHISIKQASTNNMTTIRRYRILVLDKDVGAMAAMAMAHVEIICDAKRVDPRSRHKDLGLGLGYLG